MDRGYGCPRAQLLEQYLEAGGCLRGSKEAGVSGVQGWGGKWRRMSSEDSRACRPGRLGRGWP